VQTITSLLTWRGAARSPKDGKRPADKFDVKNIISFLERDVLNMGDALKPGHGVCLDILNDHTKTAACLTSRAAVFPRSCCLTLDASSHFAA
jgi:hypothetical protein